MDLGAWGATINPSIKETVLGIVCCLIGFINGPRITIEESVYLPKIEIGVNDQMKGIAASDGEQRNDLQVHCKFMQVEIA